MPAKKLLFIFLFITSILSFLRLFKIATNSSSASPLPPPQALSDACTYKNHATMKHLSYISHKPEHHTIPPREATLTPQELHLLSTLVSEKVPCNLLFFGLRSQFLNLSKLNTGGVTVFLEDDTEKLKAPKIKGVKIYLVKYHQRASEAYELLKHAREHPACKLKADPLHRSKCKLVLTGLLPERVYKKKWDVVVVDGPNGHRPEAPGRMGTIYTAAMLARAGKNMTDVLVHDVDRIIEKWYSREFLCHENLAASKGRLWHFKIKGDSSSPRFCPMVRYQIL